MKSGAVLSAWHLRLGLHHPVGVASSVASLWFLLRGLFPVRVQPVSLFEQVGDGGAYGRGLGVRGIFLQIELKVLGAAGQQAVWTVAPVTRAEQPLAGQCQVLVPVRRVVRVGRHNLLIQLSGKHKRRYTQTDT